MIWVRATLFSVGAIVVALLAAFVGPYLPYDPTLTLASGAVDDILGIMATSMLAVTTFSLSIMVSAYASATSSVTPRSVKLLLADTTAQNTLSTFIGSFLFSIVGIIGLSSGLYSSKGRILLFFATLAVLIIVVTALLRWIEHLGRFGRVGDTIMRVEKAARDPLEYLGRCPFLGARPHVDPPEEAAAICSPITGYIQHIDIDQLNEIAVASDVTVHLMVMAGSMVHPERPLLRAHPSVDENTCERICACFSIGKEREFDHDPRFGLIVLSEIASRALSPAVNDPGTAIDVAGAGLRLFLGYAKARSQVIAEPTYQRIHAPGLDLSNLVDSFFNPIARDGAAILEVQQRLIVVLRAMGENHPALFSSIARGQARLIVARSRTAMEAETDRNRLAEGARDLL